MNSHIKSTTLVFGLVLALFLGFISFTNPVSACSTANDCFPPVQGNCYASVSRAEIGQSITWRTSVSGGNGLYSYRWSGTDGLTGNYPTISKSYSSEGTKTATVQITSYGQTISRTCSLIIEEDEPQNPDLSVNCVANPSSVEVGENVAWTATASGGNGSYSYSWSGTDSLSGSSRTVNKSYSSEGTKNGTVRVTSDGETETATCSTVVEEEPDHCSNNNDCFPPVQGNCYASVSRAEIGQSITWRTSVSGGNGLYSYRWSGTDGLTGNYPTISKSYSSEGTKTATVQITSYGQTISRTCSLVIDEEEENDDLTGYCEAVSSSNPEVGDRITWKAYPSGGDGDYDYDWSGSESLDGDERTIYKEYDNDGRKTATVRITSDGRSITKTCDINIDEEDEDDEDLDAYCKASPSRGDVGDRIKWTVYADGGDGDYDYEWDGDEDLEGDNESEYITYETDGRKDAEVEVRSNGDRVTARCDIDIDDEDEEDEDEDDGIYLSSIPATGISPGMKTGLFATGVVLWSAFLGYLYVSRRNEKKREQEILNSLK